MKTFKDGEGVVHEVIFAYGVNDTRSFTNRSRCGEFDDIHRGDVYEVHRRAVTCVSCAAMPPNDVG